MFSHEIKSSREVSERCEEASSSHLVSYDALQEEASSSRSVASGDVGSPLREEVIDDCEEELSRYQQELIDLAISNCKGKLNEYKMKLREYFLKDEENINKYMENDTIEKLNLCKKELMMLYMINGEEKLNKYKREYILYKNGDRKDTLGKFNNEFETKIEEQKEGMGAFLVKSQAKEGEASYTNIININNGEIRGLANFKNSTIGWHFSEVIFNQIQLVMQEVKKDIASFDFKNWRGENIINQSTKSVVELFLSAGTNNGIFEKGSPEFIALVGTQTAQSKFYLLAQHQKAFGKKEVTSITVERQPNGYIQINYRYDQDSCKNRSNVSNGNIIFKSDKKAFSIDLVD